MNGWIRLVTWGVAATAAYYWLDEIGGHRPSWQISVITACFVGGIFWVVDGFKRDN